MYISSKVVLTFLYDTHVHQMNSVVFTRITILPISNTKLHYRIARYGYGPKILSRNWEYCVFGSNLIAFHLFTKIISEDLVAQ